jgi:hypothetical protein
MPPELTAYFDDFSRGRFYAAHEDLEPLWWARGSDPLLQGLILFAAAYVKLQRGNPRGAARHLEATARYLEPYAPRARGIEVSAILDQVAAARAVLEGAPEGEDLVARVPPFAFRVDAGAAGWAPAPPLPPGELEAAIRAEVAARRARGEPVGPTSWGAVAKEVSRRTGGRVPRAQLRAAVRESLDPPRG